MNPASVRRSLLTLATAFTLSPAAQAVNHVETVAPIGDGPFAVACSNIAQDASRIAALGSSATDIWEGRPLNGEPRYISQVLSAPGTALQFDAPVPDNRDIYPRYAGGSVPNVAIVCHPTPQSNPDPDYVLPGTGDLVPHMQQAGGMPRLVSAAEYAAAYGTLADPATALQPAHLPMVVFSHGLGGSPISPGYLDAMVDLASHGFVVAAVFHGDPRFSKIRINDLGDAITVLTHIDEFVEMELLRPASLKALVDTILAHPGFAPGVDPERIAGFGASLGGQAMANLLGARLTVGLGGSCHDTVNDPRIKAAVGLVPYAGQVFLPSFCKEQAGAAKVDRPYLAIAGTADTTAPIVMTELAINLFQGSHYLVALEGVKHEYLPAYRGDVMTWTVTFLDAYLHVPRNPGAMGQLFRMSSVSGGPNDSLLVDVHVPFVPAGDEATVTELFDFDRGHFFMSAGTGEIASLVAGSGGPGWKLTGLGFNAYARQPAAAAGAIVPVCRFQGLPADGSSSHFFTADAAECESVKHSGGWLYEGTAFHVRPVAADRSCPPGNLQVLRSYNRGLLRTDPDHRFTTSDSTYRAMGLLGWAPEGAVMCAEP